jgi:Cu(I)/Ag(I) efflux system membrane protein CusA/SilA
MLIYLDHAWREIKALCAAEGRPPGGDDLRQAIMIGAVERVRPKMMTTVSIMAGLLPILWATGATSEVTRRIAVPMVGGMVTSTLLTLIVIPAIYGLVKSVGAARREPVSAPGQATVSGVRQSASRTIGKPRPM